MKGIRVVAGPNRVGPATTSLPDQLAWSVAGYSQGSGIGKRRCVATAFVSSSSVSDHGNAVVPAAAANPRVPRIQVMLTIAFDEWHAVCEGVHHCGRRTQRHSRLAHTLKPVNVTSG